MADFACFGVYDDVPVGRVTTHDEMDEGSLRRGIVDYCLRMNATGLNQGTSGNISARWRDGLLISPSGVPYENLEPEDIVFLRYDGAHEGRMLPSSEWRFHAAIMESRPAANAVVHTHSTYSTAIAIKRLDIPPLHYMIAAVGGPSIRCTPYVTFGTPELAKLVLKALDGRSACLLANHGMIATGPSLEKAMWLAVEVETLARQYFNTLSIGGPELLSDEEIERTIEKFKTYGQPTD